MRKFDPLQFSADREVGGPVARAIWHSRMCPLAQALQKSETLPHSSTLTKPRQSCGALTKNAVTEEVLMVLYTCVGECVMVMA